MPDQAPRTVRVFADTVARFTTRCRSRTCRAPIWFAQSAGRGKMMPFDGTPVAVRTELEVGTGRTVWHVAETQLHFVTCPAAKRRPKPKPAPTEWQNRKDES